MTSLRSKTNLFLLIILLLALWLRIFHLTTALLGFSEDEASIGYNAYSILHTGKDEWGRVMPISFEAFGDYKLPLSAYLTVPLVAILGLTETAVRLPAAMLGVLAVYLMFVVTKKMFKSEVIALIAALLLSVSPWFTQLSRFDTGAVLAVDLVLVELILILSEMKLKKKMLLLSLTLIGALMSSAVAWLVAPLLLMFCLLKELPGKISIKYLVIFIGIILILGAVLRQGLNAYYLKDAFYKDIGYQNRINKLKGYDNHANLNKLGTLTQNKLWIGLDTLGKNYLKGFDVYYLVSGGDYHDKFISSDLGKIYALDVVFFLIGCYFLLRLENKNKSYIWLLLLTAPLPNLLATDNDLSQRFYFFLVPFYLLTSFGFISLIERFKKFRWWFIYPSTLLTLLSVFAFFNYYFTYYPPQSLKNWNYGYSQIAQVAQSSQYSKIVISDRLSQKPYIFTLFYNKFDPKVYQTISKDRGGYGFIATTAFDKYEYRSINWDNEKKDKGTLYVGFNDEIPDISCTKKEFQCLPSQTLPDQKTTIKYLLVR